MDRTTAQGYLVEAEAARHQLATGARAVEVVESDGARVRYAEADMAALDRYIAQLRIQASASGRHAIGFRF